MGVLLFKGLEGGDVKNGRLQSPPFVRGERAGVRGDSSSTYKSTRGKSSLLRHFRIYMMYSYQLLTPASGKRAGATTDLSRNRASRYE